MQLFFHALNSTAIKLNRRWTYVKLQNLTFVSRQDLQLLSRLQNWIYPKTCQYKTCIVSNTKIAVPSGITEPKTWQSHLTSETVEIFIKAAG